MKNRVDSDPDLHCFQKSVYNFEKIICIVSYFSFFDLVSLMNETRPISYHLNQFKTHELISKRYKLACAPIKDTDQTSSPHSLSRVLMGALWVDKGPMFLQMEN